MGAFLSIFGRVTEETPSFSVLKKTDEYETRRYSPSVAITTSYVSDHMLGKKHGGAFFSLAKYIGVLSEAENERREKIAMTAPVSMKKEEMGGETKGGAYAMRFFLPASKFSRASDAPKPTSDDVNVIEIPERVVAVRTFSGYLRRNNVEENKEKLLEALRGDASVKISKIQEQKMEVYGYNAPWTISWLRTNEIILPIDFSSY